MRRTPAERSRSAKLVKNGCPVSASPLNRHIPAPHTYLELETIMGLLDEQRSRAETSTTGRE